MVMRASAAALLAAAVVAVAMAPARAQAGSVVRVKVARPSGACVAARRACASRRPRARASATTYQNPVFGSFPDPMAMLTGTVYYAYATGDRFPIIRSTDLVSWTTVGTAFPSTAPPKWSSGNPWAPSVLQDPRRCPDAATSTSTSCFFMYYVGLNNALPTPSNCIGVATADSPAGPFRDHGMLTLASGAVDPVRGPIGCGDGGGYSNIDAAPYRDSATGKTYLYLSTGHDATGAWHRTLSVIPLASDLIHASGSRVALFAASQSWEGGVVENPWPEKHRGYYYVFYSGGNWADATYAMGYARSTTPTGFFIKRSANPILKSTANVIGPGGGSVTVGPHGGDWMVYHGRAYAGGPRTLRIDPVLWNDTTSPSIATIRGPTTSPQPAP
jgi:arabinan endo-1,5-alpha-L-arabinosidase